MLTSMVYCRLYFRGSVLDYHIHPRFSSQENPSFTCLAFITSDSRPCSTVFLTVITGKVIATATTATAVITSVTIPVTGTTITVTTGSTIFIITATTAVAFFVNVVVSTKQIGFERPRRRAFLTSSEAAFSFRTR